MHPEDPLSKHFRLAPPHVSALRKLGIRTIEDLLRHFPARYDRAGEESAITALMPGSEVTLFGTIDKLETRRSWKRKIPVGEARITDATGSIKVMWFHQPYIAKKFAEGMFVKAVGQVGGKDGNYYLANPHVEPADLVEYGLFKVTSSSAKGSPSPSLFAVYPESRGVTSLWFRHAIERILSAKGVSPPGRSSVRAGASDRKSGVLNFLEDPIPVDVRDRYHLPDLSTALVWIHTPEKDSHAQAARKRFAFEEIFTIQVARAKERVENDAQSSFPIQDAQQRSDLFLSSLDMRPTGAQRRAIDEILEDFKKPHPMARLLEGDVGSGKTLVAAASAYAAVTSRPPLKLTSGEFGRTADGAVARRTSGTLQVAYMAPTEILAMQHFQSFITYFKDLPINIGLITGSGCKKFPSKIAKGSATDVSRAQLLKWVANGEIAMLVGTHAIIQKSIQFQHLAYAIVDEQHRFGTKQRRALTHKSDSSTSGQAPVPHFLSMTATPIPRTLSLTIYGDLDLSILDELPPGRAKITTKILKSKDRNDAYEAMRKELEKGRQAYVICPRIEEPDPAKQNALQAKSAKAEALRLQKDIFPDYDVGLLHGAMTPTEKDSTMREFEHNKIQVLVATSVVEVGINVPNATVMMIEGAERFGLAQLHQLRGRIMRSSHPPFCFLLPESKSEISMKRLRTLEKSDDGFKLAEADLEARGAGDLYGTKQWGVTDIGMEALKNPRLIAAARTEAQQLVAQDSTLSKHPSLAQRVANTGKELHGE